MFSTMLPGRSARREKGIRNTMPIYIRRMREEDIPQVVEIEKIAFSRPWSKSVFKAAILLPYMAFYVAVQTGGAAEDRTGKHMEKIVGMCGVKKVFEDGEISNVAVHPACRGRGISRRMLAVLMREAGDEGVTSFTLEVRAGNVPAICLYESFGFRTEGIRPRFYEDPVEDGLVMWLRNPADAAGSQFT